MSQQGEVRLWSMNTTSAMPTSGSRSEEHTSELQSQSNLVCRLLLEKKKNNAETNIFKRKRPLYYWRYENIPPSVASAAHSIIDLLLLHPLTPPSYTPYSPPRRRSAHIDSQSS